MAKKRDFQLTLKHKEKLSGFAVEVLYFACAGRHALVKHGKITPAKQLPSLAIPAPIARNSVGFAFHWLDFPGRTKAGMGSVGYAWPRFASPRFSEPACSPNYSNSPFRSHASHVISLHC